MSQINVKQENAEESVNDDVEYTVLGADMRAILDEIIEGCDGRVTLDKIIEECKEFVSAEQVTEAALVHYHTMADGQRAEEEDD